MKERMTGFLSYYPGTNFLPYPIHQAPKNPNKIIIFRELGALTLR